MKVRHLARVQGELWSELPTDLYIPPDALEVILEAFEGPLDLLLWLIRRNSLNVLDINMTALTRQYIGYVEAMHSKRLELAAEYLVMAAMLIEIKSRMLLPRPEKVLVGEDLDPRAELVRRLLEYERMKLSARCLGELPQAGRDFLLLSVHLPQLAACRLPQVASEDLLAAWGAILKRATMSRHHRIGRQELSLREHMSRILKQLQENTRRVFADLFDPAQGRSALVVSFLALLAAGDADAPTEGEVVGAVGIGEQAEVRLDRAGEARAVHADGQLARPPYAATEARLVTRRRFNQLGPVVQL